MKVLQVLNHLARTPSKINFPLESRCFFTQRYLLAIDEKTTEESVPLQRRKSPRKYLSSVLKQELDVKSWELLTFYRAGACETLDKYSIRHRLQNLRGMGYANEEIKSELLVLLLPIKEVAIRRAILEECGIKGITTTLLCQFEVILRRRVRLLKISGLIPTDLNVPEHILSHADKDVPPPDLNGLRKLRHGSPQEIADVLPLGDLHKHTVLHYISWYLNDPTVFKKRRLFDQISLRQVKEAYDALQNLKVSKQQLAKCLQLAQCDSKNLDDLLSIYKSIGGEDFKKMIQKHPKIALCSPSDVQAVLSCVKDYGFNEKTIAAQPDILTANVNVLQQGLTLLQYLPDLWALRHSDGILRLLSQRQLISKLQYFNSLPHRVVPTVSLLSSGNAAISRALQRNSARRPVTDFLKLLAVELSTEEANVRSIISRHPQWRLGSASEMLSTLSLLRSYGFSDQNILENVQILLYSSSYVQGVLEKAFDHLSPSGTSNTVPSKTDLSLCLYYIERQNGFTGMGISQKSELIKRGNLNVRDRCRGKPCSQDCCANPLCVLRLGANQCEEGQERRQTL